MREYHLQKLGVGGSLDREGPGGNDLDLFLRTATPLDEGCQHAVHRVGLGIEQVLLPRLVARVIEQVVTMGRPRIPVSVVYDATALVPGIVERKRSGSARCRAVEPHVAGR